MDYMSNKALIIAVSLLITIMISSAVLYTVNQVIGVYKQVYETDTLIQSRFDEFDAYDGTEKTELELFNTAKKYKNNGSVYVTLTAKGNLVGSDENKISIAENHGINIDSLKSSLSIDENEKGEVSVNTGKASKKYNAYVERLSNGSTIIGFVEK